MASKSGQADIFGVVAIATTCPISPIRLGETYKFQTQITLTLTNQLKNDASIEVVITTSRYGQALNQKSETLSISPGSISISIEYDYSMVLDKQNDLIKVSARAIYGKTQSIIDEEWVICDFFSTQ